MDVGETAVSNDFKNSCSIPVTYSGTILETDSSCGFQCRGGTKRGRRREDPVCSGTTQENQCHIKKVKIDESSPNSSNFQTSTHIDTFIHRTDSKPKNNYQYFSDSELRSMSIDYENSSLKNSFSMSSLQGSGRRRRLDADTSEIRAKPPFLPFRPYRTLSHGLRNKNCVWKQTSTEQGVSWVPLPEIVINIFGRHSAPPSERGIHRNRHPQNDRSQIKQSSPDPDLWNNSFNQDDHKDEFWTAFQSNYQYLMNNNNLIESCAEAKNDLNRSSSLSEDWSYDHFQQQFLELESWLNDIRITANSNDNRTALSIPVSVSGTEELKRRNVQRKTLVSQSSRLLSLNADKKDEILDMVSTINTMWDSLCTISQPHSSDTSFRIADAQYELHCLKKWLIAMEQRVEPLKFQKKWTISELKSKIKDHEAIQVEVQSQGKSITSVLKVLEKVFSKRKKTTEEVQNSQSTKYRKQKQLLADAKTCEKRWQLLFIKCLEWQCYLEHNITNLHQGSDGTDSEYENEQPVFKHRRLNSSYAENPVQKAEGTVKSNVAVEYVSCSEQTMSSSNEIQMPLVEDKMNADIKLNDNFQNFRAYNKETFNNMLNETALYCRSGKIADNLGLYYCKHIDTDSEQEKKVDISKRRRSTDSKTNVEDDGSSEGELTYTSTMLRNQKNDEHQKEKSRDHDQLKSSDDSETKENSREDLNRRKLIKVEKKSIQKLVDRVEELVQSPKKTQKMKEDDRVREWLSKCHSGQNDDEYSANDSSIGYSCDASSELSEDEDQHDVSDRRSSCGDQTNTIVGSSRDDGIDQSPGDTTLFPDESTPKVVLRAKNGATKAGRPFSTSELGANIIQGMECQFSVSESALHSITSPLGIQRANCFSSSTIEHASPDARRRKFKFRRRNCSGRKNECGSADSLSSLTCRESSPKRSARPYPLSRLESWQLEPVRRRRMSASAERSVVSDRGVVASGTETEEEWHCRRSLFRRKVPTVPTFRLGPLKGVVTTRGEKMSADEHQSSSFSWDNYQDKYNSEALSGEDPIDQEQLKKLAEFGDDYRNCIDSQSDCASNFSVRKSNFMAHSTPTGDDSPMDSESDIEAVHSFLRRSHSLLRYSEQLFAKQTAKPASCFSLSISDFADLRNTCRENAQCLRVLIERIEQDTSLFSTQQIYSMKGMLDQWEHLECQTDEVEKKCSLQKDIRELRKQLVDIADKLPDNIASQLHDRMQLEQNIKILKMELDFVENQRNVMSEFNVKARTLVMNSKCSIPSLEDEIIELYRVHERARFKLTEKLNMLKKGLSTWHQFDACMNELKIFLRADHKTLDLFDHALEQPSSITPDIAVSVKNFTKFLTENGHVTETTLQKKFEDYNDDEESGICSMLLKSSLTLGEGSFSDSGISDSGSEFDLIQRQQRLVVLKNLARHLESILAPGSEALISIMKKIDEAEEELKELQETCRTLIIKSANYESKIKRSKSVEEVSTTDSVPNGKTASPEPDRDPPKKRSFFWRVLRASLPFHMAIMVLFCVACLLEPNCCDAINNLNLSLAPQLRYVSGPPPT